MKRSCVHAWMGNCDQIQPKSWENACFQLIVEEPDSRPNLLTMVRDCESCRKFEGGKKKPDGVPVKSCLQEIIRKTCDHYDLEWGKDEGTLHP